VGTTHRRDEICSERPSKRRQERTSLIDEYRLVIHPVAIGHGTGLFGALREPLRLDLVEARTFPSGTMIHTYRPHEGNR
jgi:dihydrofolate reductase